jgi:AcrR family transcriptional regulator
MSQAVSTRSAAPRRKRVNMRPEDRLEDILSVAGPVFAEKGFEAATVEDVTTAAKIGKGTFYLYFQSKEHLLAVLWSRYVDKYLAATVTIIESSEDWWPTMDRLAGELVGHAVRNADLHRLVYGSANAKALELCRESNRRVIDTIGAFIARGAQAGAFQARDTDITHRMLYFGIVGLLDDLITRRAEIRADDLVASALEMVHRCLGDPAFEALPIS